MQLMLKIFTKSTNGLQKILDMNSNNLRKSQNNLHKQTDKYYYHSI